MRPVCFFICLMLTVATEAQPAKTIALPEFSCVYRQPDGYRWKKVCEVRGRTMFGNTLLPTDSILYSFGGFDTKVVQREMNLFTGSRLRRDASIKYPGRGFTRNIGFSRDSFFYIGGGVDSGAARYSGRDFWQYNRYTRTWKRLKELPFYYFHKADAFEHRGRTVIYLEQLSGPRFEIITPSFYTYDAASDTWSLLSNEMPVKQAWMPLTFRMGAEVFVLFQEQGTLFGRGPFNQFYKFHLDSLKWAPLAGMPGAMREFAFAFADDQYGYIGGGMTKDAVYTKNVFRYDPYKDRWEEITQLPRFIRRALGWYYKGERYVGFGMNDEPNTIAIWKLKAP